MRKPITALILAAALAATLTQAKPAAARCRDCWAGVAAGLLGGAVIAGWSHAYTYGSIYGPYFAYPPYSEYGYAPYGYFEPAYGYHAPPPCCAASVQVPPVYVHHARHRRYAHHDSHHHDW